MEIRNTVPLVLALTLLAGCDPAILPLKPDVPQESLSEIKKGEWLLGWYAQASQQGIVFKIRGYIFFYVGEGNAYLAFPMKITNTRAHPIRLTRDDIAVKIDESRSHEPIELQQVNMTEKEQRTVTTPTHNVREITVGSGSTAFVDVLLRDDRVRTGSFPRDSVILYLNAFQDLETGERIPFAIRFLRQ